VESFTSNGTEHGVPLAVTAGSQRCKLQRVRFNMLMTLHHNLGEDGQWLVIARVDPTT